MSGSDGKVKLRKASGKDATCTCCSEGSISVLEFQGSPMRHDITLCRLHLWELWMLTGEELNR